MGCVWCCVRNETIRDRYQVTCFAVAGSKSAPFETFGRISYTYGDPDRELFSTIYKYGYTRIQFNRKSRLLGIVIHSHSPWPREVVCLRRWPKKSCIPKSTGAGDKRDLHTCGSERAEAKSNKIVDRKSRAHRQHGISSFGV